MSGAKAALWPPDRRARLVCARRFSGVLIPDSFVSQGGGRGEQEVLKPWRRRECEAVIRLGGPVSLFLNKALHGESSAALCPPPSSFLCIHSLLLFVFLLILPFFPLLYLLSGLILLLLLYSLAQSSGEDVCRKVFSRLFEVLQLWILLDVNYPQWVLLS